MRLTETNWLKELKNEILKEKKLYPGGEPIHNLNSTNWLSSLRDDLLSKDSNNTLKPNTELNRTNWLLRIRDDILKRQELYPEIISPEVEHNE